MFTTEINFVENSEESKPKYDTENNLNINKTYEETNLLFPYAIGLLHCNRR